MHGWRLTRRHRCIACNIVQIRLAHGWKLIRAPTTDTNCHAQSSDERASASLPRGLIRLLVIALIPEQLLLCLPLLSGPLVLLPAVLVRKLVVRALIVLPLHRGRLEARCGSARRRGRACIPLHPGIRHGDDLWRRSSRHRARAREDLGSSEPGPHWPLLSSRTEHEPAVIAATTAKTLLLVLNLYCA